MLHLRKPEAMILGAEQHSTTTIDTILANAELPRHFNTANICNLSCATQRAYAGHRFSFITE